MSSKDTLIYDLSTSGSSAEPNVMMKKTMLTIFDSNTTYNSGQSRISTSAISNSTYLDMKNAYLSVPLLITIQGEIQPAQAATNLDYSVGLIPFSHNLIHSMSVSVNGEIVKSFCNFENLFHHFRLLSLLSANELKTLGHIGFHEDDITCFRWSASATTEGNGVSRNRVVGAFDNVKTALANYSTHNKGFLDSMKSTNYNESGVIGSSTEKYSSLLSSNNVNQLRRSRIFNNVDRTGAGDANGVKQIQIDCVIPLKTFNFFENLPLVKGSLYEIICNWNQCAFDVSTDANKKLSCGNVNVTHPFNGTNCLMLASAGTNEPNSALLASKTYRVSLAVGNKCLDTSQINAGGANIQQSKLQQQVELRVPSYALNAEYEASYISNPIKEVVFKDLQHYQLTNVGSDTGFTHLITSGTANLCSLLVIPQFTAEAHCTTALTPTLSPFDTGVYPSPLATVGNFNVRVAGEPVFNEDQKYDRDLFLEEIAGARSINSGLTQGLASGMISRTAYQMAPYIYVNLARGDPISKGIPKSVQISGTNFSAKACSYHIFLEYERKVSVDVLTGQFMSM